LKFNIIHANIVRQKNRGDEKMNKSVYQYISELNKANAEIANSQSLINEKNEQYRREIAPYEESIIVQNNKKSEIKGISVYASFQEILKQLAKMWNTTPEDLVITYNTSYDCTSNYNYAKDNAKKFNNMRANARQIIAFNFYVLSRLNNSSQFAGFKSCIPIDTLQLDNKPLSLHLEAKIFETDGEDFNVGIIIDDLNQLLLKFPLHSLVDMNTGEIKDEQSKAIIDASEIYRKQTLTSAM